MSCIGLVPQNPWRFARKKPVIISFREPIPEDEIFDRKQRKKVTVEKIKTREGVLYAFCGRDYVIKGIEGEIYPIDKKIFAETYEVLGQKVKT